MKNKNHRQKTEIIINILGVLSEGQVIAGTITRRVRISHKVLFKYLDMLLLLKYVRRGENKDATASLYDYILTEKGRELHAYLFENNIRIGWINLIK